MDYTQELRNLLRPLGIYDVDTGVGRAELESIGKELNAVWAALESAEREMSPLTADGYGLAVWEKLLPFVPAYLTADDRRRAIAALLQIDGCGFTAAALNKTVTGCGIRAKVEEAEEAMTVVVSFPYNRGRPGNIDELRERIEQILPCHLNVEYHFILATFAELMALFATWADIESAAYTWHMMECAGGEQ